MPFFDGCNNFEVNGGQFADVQGNLSRSSDTRARGVARGRPHTSNQRGVPSYGNTGYRDGGFTSLQGRSNPQFPPVNIDRPSYPLPPGRGRLQIDNSDASSWSSRSLLLSPSYLPPPPSSTSSGGSFSSLPTGPYLPDVAGPRWSGHPPPPPVVYNNTQKQRPTEYDYDSSSSSDLDTACLPRSAHRGKRSHSFRAIGTARGRASNGHSMPRDVVPSNRNMRLAPVNLGRGSLRGPPDTQFQGLWPSSNTHHQQSPSSHELDERQLVFSPQDQGSFSRPLRSPSPPCHSGSPGTGAPFDTRNPEEIKPGTFAIYSYHDERTETSKGSFTIDDLTCVQANMGIGGCLTRMSIHEPAEASSWIEENWDNPLVTSIQNSGCDGPFPCMLSPTEPAFAIFGYYDDPKIVNIAESLTELSGFPVVVRPSGDNPALTLLTRDTDPHESVQFNDTAGNGGNDGDEEDEGMSENERDPGESGNGNQRDDDRDADKSDENDRGDAGASGSTAMKGKWESQLHTTRVKLRLKLDAAHAYAVNIGYDVKFTINRETEIPIDLEDMTRPLSQPEVIALVDFEIETRPRETQLDRSYASIGFVVHRSRSINKRKFMDRGFGLPDKLYKRGQQRHIQRGLQAALGFSQGSPLGITTFSYNRNNDAILEATDNKVMPRCHVRHEIGDEWVKDNKSYSSYNIVYQLQDIQLDAEQSDFHPLEVKVGMGINLRPPGSEKPLPQISFINRNQVLIWVSDPTRRAGIRGIVVLMSSYLENVRTAEKLSIYEDEEIELKAGPLNVPQTKMEEHEPGTISLSIAQVQNQSASGSNKLAAAVPAFISKLAGRPSVSPPTYIPPHEYLARGWDTNNGEWRSVLWPALDKDFRAAKQEKTSPVWEIQPQWTQAQTTNGTNIQP